mgnify:CR=1 FL=1
MSSRYLFASNVRIFEKEQDAKYPDLRRFRRLGQNVPLEKVVHDIATVHLVFNLYNVAQRKVVQSVAEKAFYERIAKNTFIAMVSLALFYFIFLESNSFYLSSMSSFSLEPRFVTTIVPIMGLNALGFLCYPLYSLKLSRRKRRGTALVFAILWIACLIIAATVSSPIAIVGAGYLSFFIMGVLGGNAYFGVAMMLAQSNRLITSVALAHAAGILLHLIAFTFHWEGRETLLC